MDIATLAFHERYIASDSVIIGDGSGLSIAHIGSFSLTSLSTLLLFNNVLHVSATSENLISVSALCVDKPINFLFLTLSFRCRIITWGSLLFSGSVEMVFVTGRSSSPLSLPLWCCPV